MPTIYVYRPCNRKRSKMIRAADECLWFSILVKGSIWTLGLQLVPLPLPILIKYTLHLVLIPHLFGAQPFKRSMFDRHVHKDRFGKVFYFFIPNVAQFVCAEGLRS